MLPTSYDDDLIQDYDIAEQTTRTYRLNFDGRNSAGMLDGREAMKQAIYLILNTERYRYEMYSWDYGIELEELIGDQNSDTLQVNVRNTITDALIQDDRITEVSDFEFKREHERLSVTFSVTTTEGDIQSELSWWGDRLEVKI